MKLQFKEVKIGQDFYQSSYRYTKLSETTALHACNLTDCFATWRSTEVVEILETEEVIP